MQVSQNLYGVAQFFFLSRNHCKNVFVKWIAGAYIGEVLASQEANFLTPLAYWHPFDTQTTIYVDINLRRHVLLPNIVILMPKFHKSEIATFKADLFRVNSETLETCEDEFGRSGLRFPLLTVGGSILR